MNSVDRKADAVIVGGGILGASVAYFLTRAGFGDVVLIEKNRLASGSTGYSAANVRQHYSNEVAIRLAVRGTQMFRTAEDELGGPVGFVETGYMVIAPHGHEEALRTAIAEQRRLGVETHLLTVDEIAAAFPQLNLEDVTLGALETNSGYADPVLTVRTLVGAAQSRGLKVYENLPVTGIAVENDAVAGVSTPAGDIETGVVVNAAGPWAASVGAMVGIHYDLSLSREHEVIVTVPPDLGPIPIVSDPGQSLFFRPHGSDELLIGEGYPKDQEPCDPDTYNRRADDPVIDRMLARLRHRVPRLVKPPRVKDYAGIYTITDDWYPIVGGEDGFDGYYCAIGGSGHSFKIGPPIGEALADMIAGRRPTIDIEPLHHRRFAAEQVFASVWGPGNRG